MCYTFIINITRINVYEHQRRATTARLFVSDEHNSERTSFLYPQFSALDPSFRLPPQLRAEVSIFCRGLYFPNLTPSCNIKGIIYHTPL